MTIQHDQFTRWTCPKCGGDGIDSWNKAVWDGPGFTSVEEIPNPWILGGECWQCLWPCVVMYTGADASPRAIYRPTMPAGGERIYDYEDSAFKLIDVDPAASVELEPAATRDADWSRGCLAAQGQLQ